MTPQGTTNLCAGINVARYRRERELGGVQMRGREQYSTAHAKKKAADQENFHKVAGRLVRIKRIKAGN
jgi:hypothetical protein